MGADYTFEAQLESYRNPTRTLSNGNCCDGVAIGVCTDPCVNIFTFCIQESNATGSNLALPMCPFLRRVSGVFQDDDITFDVDLGNGVSNPLIFNRSGTWPVSQEYVFVSFPSQINWEGTWVYIFRSSRATLSWYQLSHHMFYREESGLLHDQEILMLLLVL